MPSALPWATRVGLRRRETPSQGFIQLQRVCDADGGCRPQNHYADGEIEPTVFFLPSGSHWDADGHDKMPSALKWPSVILAIPVVPRP